jgi:hypothetical protein
MESKFMKYTILATAIGFGIAVFGLSAKALTILSPVSAVASSDVTCCSILKTIDQSALSINFNSGIDNFDTYMAGNPLHNAAVFDEWFTAPQVSSAVVTYDLGAIYDVKKMALWNEESAGIGPFNLLTSINNINYTLIVSGLTATDHAASTNNYPADVFMVGSHARYIRLDIQSCPQSGNGYEGCGIGEVAFGVPSPASLSLFGLGLFAIGFARRHKTA